MIRCGLCCKRNCFEAHQTVVITLRNIECERTSSRLKSAIHSDDSFDQFNMLWFETERGQSTKISFFFLPILRLCFLFFDLFVSLFFLVENNKLVFFVPILHSAYSRRRSLVLPLAFFTISFLIFWIFYRQLVLPVNRHILAANTAIAETHLNHNILWCKITFCAQMMLQLFRLAVCAKWFNNNKIEHTKHTFNCCVAKSDFVTTSFATVSRRASNTQLTPLQF